MPETSTPNPAWPALPFADWADTCETLHRWTQIIGKVRLRLMPWTNHGWHVTLYVTPRGLSTGNMPYGTRAAQIDLDLVTHELRIITSTGDGRTIPLRAVSVARFYVELFAALHEMGIEVTINPIPNELPDTTPLDRDQLHGEYDPEAAARFANALVQIERVFTKFRARFRGKCSPVHFFWGSFDLAVTRFSGGAAPTHPGGVMNLPDWVTREAYCHEVCSAGFWPGSADAPDPIFYTYAYPEPVGFASMSVEPGEARYDAPLGEFVLPYDAVRRATDPDAYLMTFLQSTYTAAAERAGWDRGTLEQPADPREAA